MPTPKHSVATGVPESVPTAPQIHASSPDALEARLREVAESSSSTDFDAMSWFWMILLGALLPLGLIAYGWLANGAAR